jgi:hypothetical protein
MKEGSVLHFILFFLNQKDLPVRDRVFPPPPPNAAAQTRNIKHILTILLQPQDTYSDVGAHNLNPGHLVAWALRAANVTFGHP